MKASELMIGDLVYIYTFPNENPKQEDLMVARLVGVNSDEIDENPIPFCEGRILSTNGIFSRPIDTLIPIPLTEEILNANGFTESQLEEGTYNFPIKSIHNRGYAIETDDNKEFYITGHELMKFRYVHELQRALRCCGLWDMAEKFKIK